MRLRTVSSSRSVALGFKMGWWLFMAWPFAAQSEHASSRPPITARVSFQNDVMAVLSKSGCNAGTCHGNKNGKGGFKLSLRGQDPLEDFLSLTRETFGRRISILEPAQSLLLKKPTTQVSHEGGVRFGQDSENYQILLRWIAAGAVDDFRTAPRLERLEVKPNEAILFEPDFELNLEVLAAFSDGTVRDVTGLAVYEPASKVVEVSPDGRARGLRPGEATVLVRYLHLQQPVRLAFVPGRPDFVWKEIPEHNYVDKQIFAKLRTMRMNPSELCSDEVFLRRAYLDLLGILPTAEEAKSFLEQSTADLHEGSADKQRFRRARLVDRLLERPEFADFWALKWADLLRVEAHALDEKGTQNFHHWIRQSLAENKPLDEFARELIAARGSTYAHPAANYYRSNRDPVSRAKAAAQVFLGTRLQCAECHNHPFDRWTQDDYYDWAALFSDVQYKVIQNDREIGSDRHEWKGEQVVYFSRERGVTNPRNGQPAQPRFLSLEEPITSAHASARSDSPWARPLSDSNSLQQLADWLTGPDNLWFARVQANRIWSHLMGRGLVEPVDDFRATNPASHPELLDALAGDFVRHGFDVRRLIGTIMNSRAYQLSSVPNDTNLGDTLNYSHSLVRRLGAEQLLDCQSQVTEAPLRFANYPAGFRAAQLPGVRPEGKRKRRSDPLDLFLEIFGKPPRRLTSDTERSCEGNMGQAFQMMTGPALHELLAEPGNRLSRLLSSGISNAQMIEELFWAALTRPPSSQELEALLPKLVEASNRREVLEDLLWGLLNSKEFLFRH